MCRTYVEIYVCLAFLLETNMTLTIAIVFDWMKDTMEPTSIVFIFRETWEDLYALWEKLPRQMEPGETHANPHWRKTLPMSNMC